MLLPEDNNTNINNIIHNNFEESVNSGSLSNINTKNNSLENTGTFIENNLMVQILIKNYIKI